MAKKVIIPLDMGNDIFVRTIDGLKENFNIEKVTEHFLSGKLLEWLNGRHYDEEAAQVQELMAQNDKDNLASKLGEIFGIEIEDDIDIDSIDNLRQRTNILRTITSDDYILENPQLVAFSQEELDELLKTEDIIYLYGEKFEIDVDIKNRTYIGLNNPEVDFIGGIESHIEDIRNCDLVGEESFNISFDSVNLKKILFTVEFSVAVMDFLFANIVNEETCKIVFPVHEAYGYKLLFNQIYK